MLYIKIYSIFSDTWNCEKQFSIKMEKSGIEPEIAICKIDVLPIKLYPLYII